MSEIKHKIIETTHLSRTYSDFGWGRGYIGVPHYHPWYGKTDSDIECDVHGGITWYGSHLPSGDDDGYWWLGFDTGHFDDTLETWPKEAVEKETLRFKEQAHRAGFIILSREESA